MLLFLLTTAAAAPHVDEVRVLGGLDRSVVEHVMEHHAGSLAVCWEGQPHGWVRLSMHRRTGGRLEEFEVTEQHAGSEAATACLIEVLESIRLPECDKGMPADVTIWLRARSA